MLVLGLTALRPRASGRPAVRMDQGVTAPEDDDAELLKRMAQQRLLGKTETQVRRTSWTLLALPLHESRTRAAAHLHRPPSRRSSSCVTSAPPQILEEMVKSEMGLDMDLSFFDKPTPPTGGDGAARKTLTEKQERLLSGKDIQVPAGVPMDSRYLDSLKSFIGDEASKAVERTAEKDEAAEEEEVRPGRASAPATPFRLRLRLVDPNSKRSQILTQAWSGPWSGP